MKTLEDFLSEIEDRACDQCGSAQAFQAAKIIREMREVFEPLTRPISMRLSTSFILSDLNNKISQILNEEE